MKHKKILIALPTDEMIHNKVVGVLCQIILNEKRYELNTYVSAMQGIGEHRNRIVKDFLAKDYDYLVMIDNDNPPPHNLLDLIDLDLEVIGLPTPVNMEWIPGVTEIFWNVFDETGQLIKETGQGLQEVNKIGTGVIIIRRDVLEKVKHPFTTIRDDEDMRTVGTDAAFCDRCREQGIKIHTHWDYRCGHYKTVNLATISTL